jgi:hypothetical protein
MAPHPRAERSQKIAALVCVAVALHTGQRDHVDGDDADVMIGARDGAVTSGKKRGNARGARRGAFARDVALMRTGRVGPSGPHGPRGTCACAVM